MIRSGMVQFHDDLKLLMVEIDHVSPHPENYNNGDIDEIVASIQINGMYRPIQAQRSSGYICVGNSTWAACKELEAEHIPVTWLDVGDEIAYRIMLTDNKTASLARPDPSQELILLERLANTEHGLTGTGYSGRELAQLRALANTPLSSGVTGPSSLWPLLCFRVEPTLKKAFEDMTRESDTEDDRLEVLMRLAGWDGSGD